MVIPLDKPEIRILEVQSLHNNKQSFCVYTYFIPQFLIGLYYDRRLVELNGAFIYVEGNEGLSHVCCIVLQQGVFDATFELLADLLLLMRGIHGSTHV